MQDRPVPPRKAQPEYVRTFSIGVLILISLIPLWMVSGIIRDRIQNQNAAARSIENSWAGQQTLAGPVLVLPYTVTQAVTTEDAAKKTAKVETIIRNAKNFALPEQLKIDVQWKTELRKRGIYNIPVYTASITLNGFFDDAVPALKAITDKKENTAKEPYLTIALSDTRGIIGIPTVEVAGKIYNSQPGSQISTTPQGFHIPIPLEALGSEKTPFQISFDLKGIQTFYAVPSAGNVEMTGRSDWANPSFQGGFLPNSSEVTDKGFTAQWQTGILATNTLDSFSNCINAGQSCLNQQDKSFGISFMQPVTIYTQSMRAVTYGVLFVALTFAVFYVAEVLQGQRVAAVQYVLIGLSLAVFYLLLVSLSEVIGFLAAYIVASVGTAGLLTFYSRFVLKSEKAGFSVGGIVALLYAVLYLNLSSQDYALLIGSVLLFVTITAIMVLTRNVDWNNTGKLERE